MRKLILFIGALIGLAYLINGGSGPTNSTAITSSTAIKTDLRNGILNGRQADVSSLPVIQLADEYDRNEIATDLRLKGKIVEVSGTVDSITKDVWGFLRVGLVTRNQFLHASMQVDSRQETTLANLRKGQLVTFRCQKMKRWAGAPYGDDCILM
jgi:hypothetical protein